MVLIRLFSFQCLLDLVKENQLLEKLIALLCDVSENRNYYAAGTQDVHAAGLSVSFFSVFFFEVSLFFVIRRIAPFRIS